MVQQQKKLVAAMYEKNDELRYGGDNALNENQETDYNADQKEEEQQDMDKVFGGNNDQYEESNEEMRAGMKSEMQKMLQAQKQALAERIDKNLYHHEPEESSQVPI